MVPLIGGKRGKTAGARSTGVRRPGSRGGKKGAAPLRFFNIRQTEKFVFRRRSRRCLVQPPRSSLIPAFIHFSDMFPDQVQGALNKCKAIIARSPRVYLVSKEEVVFDGPGSKIPDRVWEREGTLLRMLDVVQYKKLSPDRKKALLPVERELWDVAAPFICLIRQFAGQLKQDSESLDDLETEEAIRATLYGAKSWSICLNSVENEREHTLFYNSQHGVFMQKFNDGGCTIPLVTLPCRLKNFMPLAHPSVPLILKYLESISDRIACHRTVGLLQGLRERFPSVELPASAQQIISSQAEAPHESDGAHGEQNAGADGAQGEESTEANGTQGEENATAVRLAPAVGPSAADVLPGSISVTSVAQGESEHGLPVE